MKAGYTELKGCDFSTVKGTQDGAVSLSLSEPSVAASSRCASMVDMKKGNVISQRVASIKSHGVCLKKTE